MDVKLPIYLDYHATTPIDPVVLQAMMPYLTTDFGNASSAGHAFGWKADAAVAKARSQVARSIGATSTEIVFTSGATESNNLAILGSAQHYRERANGSGKPGHIISLITEHKAVSDACREAERLGHDIDLLTVNSDGLLDLDLLKKTIREDTILVSVMAANNEIGVIQPIKEIGAICKERGVLFHTDAAQAAGKIPINVKEMGIDMLSISGHKIYGPKGIGALYIRRRDPRVELHPMQFGGGQERKIRPGTLNTPGIVGLGQALEVACTVMEIESDRLRQMRDRLLDGLRARVPDLVVNGCMTHRLCNSLNISFPHVEGESLSASLKDIACSSSSACSSGSYTPSYVLTELGREPALAFASLRFGLGRFTTEQEIEYTINKVADVVEQLRSRSPSYKAAQATKKQNQL